MATPPIPSLVPSAPLPNPSLPPELIDQIIRSIPLHPARNRRRALSRCCLVNRLFLDISRPLLYNTVPAMLDEPEEAACQLDYDTFAAVFTKLPDLDNFVGSFVTHTIPGREDKPFLSPCTLRHLTICSRFEHSLFRQVVHSSFTSLTSLAFPLDTKDAPLDLSIFPNLTSLHISLRYRRPLSPSNRIYAPTSEHFSQFVAQTLRPILISAQSLPISILKLTTTSQTIEEHIPQHRIFDLLPPTLAYLTANPLLLHPHDANLEVFINAICNRAFPRLRTLTLQPSGTSDRFKREEEAKQAVKRNGGDLPRDLVNGKQGAMHTTEEEVEEELEEEDPEVDQSTEEGG
ncbi:hypothetical protein JCM5353_000635 [Sporobolomyces roseus]